MASSNVDEFLQDNREYLESARKGEDMDDSEMPDDDEEEDYGEEDDIESSSMSEVDGQGGRGVLS